MHGRDLAIAGVTEFDIAIYKDGGIDELLVRVEHGVTEEDPEDVVKAKMVIQNQILELIHQAHNAGIVFHIDRIPNRVNGNTNPAKMGYKVQIWKTVR